MLQEIHDKAKGWVAYAIVGFIAIPFTLFGISSYLGGSNSLVAATVNGEDIPVQQVQNGVLQQRQRLSQMFGGKLPAAFSDDAIKKQVLDQIVNTTLLRQEAQNNGYRASNQEVYDEISQIPSFQKNGVFDPATYELLLASQRRNKAGFEEEVRTSLSDQQLPRALTRTAFLPTSELQRYLKLQNQVRDVKTYTLKKDDFKSDVSVSADEIKAYYDANASRFMTSEKVKLSYLELKQADLAKDVTVTEDDLKASYEENADRYLEPEQRKLAHILVTIDEKENAENAEEKALEKANSLYKQIKDGTKTFESLATTDSDDRFSAKKSGEMGVVIQADMPPVFGKTAFSLKKGEVSEPVKAEAGIEIIKVLDIIPKKQKTFEQVKSKIDSLYRTEKAEKSLLDLSDKLQTLAFENESSLDAAADAIGQKIKTSDWIEKGGIAASNDPILSSPKIMAAAFSDDVLNAGKNSELIEVNEGAVAVIRLQDHQSPKQKPLADVSKQITDILTDQKLRKLLVDKGEKALKSLRETGQWAAISSIGGSEDKVETHDGVKRTDKKMQPALLEKIFSMQKPDGAKTSFDNVVLPVGDYVLIGLSAVKDGQVQKDEALQASYTRMLAQREQTAMLKAIREKAEIKLFLENIQ